MDTNSMFSIIDIIVVACGIYALYLYIEMKRTGKIKENMLLPKGLNVKKCKDTAGFIQSIGMQQLILGITAIICGGAGLLQDYAQLPGPVIYFAAMFLFLASAVWYTVSTKKALAKYW